MKYSLDFLRPIKTEEVFEAVSWLADLPQQTWPQAGHRYSDVILLTSTENIYFKSMKLIATIFAAAMFVGDRTTASPSLAGVGLWFLQVGNWIVGCADD